MMGREFVQIVECMLGGSDQVFRVGERNGGFDSDAQREDWLTDL